MSKQSLSAKLDFIIEMIENIEQMAVLMGISQIGETLKKLDDFVVKRYDLAEDKEGSYYTRNYIVHDYEGVDLGFIENILREYLPKLKAKIFLIKSEL